MYRFICALIGGFMRILFRIEVNGTENIPEDGGVILCANHLSNWDPVLLQTVAVKRHIFYMAKDELFHTFFVSTVLKHIGAIPVKRTGSDLAAVKLALKTIKQGGMLGIFPTGQRAKGKDEGEVKAGIGLIAGKTETPVLPIHISASYRLFSKVVVNIGKCRYFMPDEGEKLSADTAQRLSDDIYSEIKALGR